MANVYSEEQVNTYTTSTQQNPDIAVLADGSYVTVWTSYGQDEINTWGVYGQRFSAQGVPIGPEFRVNTATDSTQDNPHVVAIGGGGFVVSWDDSSGVDGSGQGVVAQRFDATGAAQGGNFVVNSTTSSTQNDNGLAGYAGGFAAVWYNGTDIYLRRFDSSGNQITAETLVSTVPGQPATAQTSAQYQPEIAAHANGDLVIVWTDQGGNDGSSYGVYGRTYNAATSTFSSTFLINTTTTGNQYEPAVATLSDGGFVVVWRSDNQDGSSAGVYAQRYDSLGAKVGTEFLVNQSTTGGQYQPSVTGLSTGGFVVTWHNDNYDVGATGTTSDVYVREYNASGTAITGQVKLVSLSNSTESEPAIADLGSGNYVVAYSDNDNSATGNGTYEIAQQIFGNAAELPRQANPVVGDFTGTVTFSENLVNATPQVIDPAVSVTDPDSGNFAGGRLDLFYVQNGEATDQLGVRSQGNAFGQIGVSGANVSYGGVAIGTIVGGSNGSNLVVNLTAGATVEAVEALIQNLTYGSTSQSPGASRMVGIRLSDGDGGASEASAVTINVTGNVDGAAVVHAEEYVNTNTASTQQMPEIAVLSDGSYVTVWTSYDQDAGSTWGVFGQRFSNAGVALGNEFKVNTVTASTQDNPRVAATSDGGFVVTWEDSSGVDGSSQGIIAQRFNASGVAQGANFVVNTTTSSTQYQSAVAGYANGFAAVWASAGNAGGDSYDIYLRRFDNSGNQITAETRVSTTPGNPADAQNGAQQTPDIAAHANGNLVIVWYDQSSNDGSSYGVYGRTYNAAAGTFSDTFLVNTFTTGAQYEPAVATLSDGGFVVVWRSDNQDGSSAGVYAQRYNAAGAKVGGEFLVNETTTGGQYQPDVTGLSTGGFVVTWYNDNYDVGGTGTTVDIYIREFDAAGVAIDGQRKLVSASNSNESDPAIADLGSGNFVVAYTDYNNTPGTGNNTYDIAQQLFGSAAELARQANPVVGDFTGSVTFGENLVNATPQVIDAAISLEDSDSANFAGGRVDLFYVQGGDATDQLGVRNQGTSAGQIGVSGNTVSYGGATIGTIAAGSENGANGANLVVNLTAGATVEAVEALIQNLTYGSTSQNPLATRTVGLRVNDGDGGASQSSTVTINVVSEIEGTGAPVVHAEEYVNTNTASTQQMPEIAVLSDGSYVTVWTSYDQDAGSTWGVFGQRFSNAGVALGNEFKVNTVTASTQDNPRVAATSDGGFVVTWEDSSGVDGSSQGIIAQRFNASGVAQGANFVVNTTTSSTQYQSAVAGYANGFAAVWASAGNAGGDSYDIYLRRFDNSGNQITAETRVSTTPGNPADAQNGAQQTPDIAAHANGNLVIVWYDQSSNDGSSYGVYGRTYNAAAGTFSDTFLVNTFTTGAQYEPAVATLSDGGFVVVWRSDNQDGSSAGVYAQRYNAAGAKVGGEFLVNETTTGGQYQPDVTGLSTGGFVVTWYNDNYDVGGTGTTVDIYIREFDAAGVAIDGQRKLVSASNSNESDPAIADLGSGNFVVAYTDYNNTPGTGNNTYDIAQQLFGSAAELARASAAPVLDDLRALRTLTSTPADANYAGNAQVIDTDVHVSDVDSANFDGGQFVANLLNAASATESLGIRNQGVAAGQIGVAGANVSYGGIVIGSFAGGGAGVPLLTVTFNASANAAAVRALVENITYQNTVPPAGTTDRYVGFRLSDGDGGVSATSQVQLRIQATFTPTNIVLDDVASSVTFTESQANAGARVDDALQLDYNGPNTFNGGKLLAQFISSTGRVDDQLSILNEGNGADQVGVAGSVVSFGGIAIGTVSATLNGVNGVNLEITFNASASAQAIERVAESLVYANSSEGPNPTRMLRITVSDSANVTSAARDVVITVTPEVDPAGAVKLLGEQQSNTYELGQQTEPVVARLQGSNNGGYVIAWVSHDAQDGDTYGVFAQRYTANGSAVGPEFQVNTHTLNQQSQVTVAGLADGGYVLSWYSQTQDASGYGVFAQRYAASGAVEGAEFQVSTTTTSNQYEPAVVGLAGGGFVVAYRSDYTDATGSYSYDVLAQRYSAAGTPVGSEFTINTLVSGTQFQPQLSALSTGGFVAIWTDTAGDANSYGIVAQRFDSVGAKVGGEILVNTGITGAQQGTDVAGIAAGGFVAVWEYNNVVYAQRFDAAGAKAGAELVVNTSDAPNNISNYARVAALETGGFVVTWASSASGFLGGSGYDVFAQKFDASGVKIDGQTLVNTSTASTQYLPDIAALTGNNYVIAWAGYDNEQNGVLNTYGVYHQLFGTAGSITRGAAPVITDVSSVVTFAENLVNAAPLIIDPGVSITDSDSANFDGGRLWVSVISGYGDILQAQLPENPVAQDQLGIRNQGSAAGQVSVSGVNVSYGGTFIGTIQATGANGSDLVVLFNASASAQAVEAVIENLTYANTSSAPVDSRTISISVSDGDGATSVPRIVTINVTPEYDGAQPLYGNEIVNTYRPDTQDNSAMAGLAGGGYVTVWQSNLQDGWGSGINGQRFDANGVAVGSEFQINTYTPNAQTEPTVVGLAGGGFVVAWRSDSQDGSGAGVYAQRFDTNGVPLGNEFLVNSTTGQNQYQPSIAATADGGFVVAWYYDYYNAGFTEYADVFFQRYNAAGVAQGGETRANPAGEGTVVQSQPSIAGLNGGGFVTVWTDGSKDGSSDGVYGQRFNADGSVNGASFQVNTFTSGDQSDSHVVALTGGGFVVVWRSTAQDGGGSYGVFGQRYNAAGVAVGDEFRVNTNTAGNEYEPSLTALSHGGFAVAWRDDSRLTMQQFDANGARLDGEILVDTHDNNGNASAPAMIGLNNGAMVVSWTEYDYSSDGGDNTYQIFQQLYGQPADFVRQANPQLVDVTPSVTFAENTINTVPQLIDPGVGLFDADSANFAGGTLEVNYLTGYGAQDQLGLQGLNNQDQLGIRNEGTGAGQVGVAGNSVSFGGTTIGTIISNGANGDKLTVQFNATATPEAVEQVIENLTYANTVSNPIASRTVSIRVTDGDGGASEARSVQINVTSEVDGAVAVGLERIVNTSRAGAQAEPSVARLASGGYVVVWEDQSANDGSSYGVYGQRYDVNDNAVGAEFRVNTFTTGAQYEPQVAGLTGGGYVVVWRSDSQDGSGAGVYAQRYAADGNTVGAEFLVNTTVSQNQYQPSIAATTDGGFVVSWYYDYYNAGFTELGDVFFQRYNAAGVAQGGETRANPAGLGTNYQYQPSIAWNADGSGFVVVWRDDLGDGVGSGVFGQRFDATGATQGTRFQVNSYTDSTQEQPSVAALKGGGFIVVWESEGQDLSSTGIYAQRYDNAGVKVGAEFRVNTNISSTQSDPHVTATENGGWVVTWSDNSNPNESSGWGVFAQQYNAAGQAIDGELRINTHQHSTQYQPAIASMADGGFVVAYSSYLASGDGNGDGVPDGGNDTMEIRVQRFSNTAPDISDIAVNVNEEQSITLTYALFASGFNDPDGQSLQAVKITTLPGEGTLRLNGVAVIPDQEIGLADLQAGLLTYQGNVDFFGLDQFRWTGSDGIAFAATPVFTNINIQNVNDGPRLEAGASDTATEGTFFSHTITLNDPDPEGHQLTINWGDGTAAQVVNVGNTPSHSISHTFYENATYTVQVTANDQQGQANSTEVDSFQVAVANFAPTISLAGDASVVQGNVYTLDLGTPFDRANSAGPINDTVSEYRINWGDGTALEVYTPATLPANGIVTHTYAVTGSQNIAVTLVDEDGVHANAGSKTISVSAPAEVLTVDAGADIGVNEGAFFSKTIAFTDPTDTGANGRTYTVDWGDGQTSNGAVGVGDFAFNINHTYADGANNYSVAVTVDDNGAQQGSDSFNVAVNNVVPTVSIGAAGSVNEGSLYTINLNRNDPGADTAQQYAVHWGDGTADTVLTAAQLAAQSGNVTHTFADGSATRTVTVDVVDEDGTWLVAGTHNVSVANVAPTAAVTGADVVAEGSVYTLNVGVVADPGADTRTAYSINWGDGTTTALTVAEWATAAGSFSHTYADGAATPTITVSASDEDGSFILGSKSLTVNNVAPSVVLSGVASLNEGDTYTLNLVGSDPAGASDTLNYSIDWGDGSGVQALTAAQLAALSGNVTHTFTDDADGANNATDRNISVTVSDEDGGSSSTGKTVTVNNVAPDLTANGAAAGTSGVPYTLTLSNYIDPGQDTLAANGIGIDWGDGSGVQNVNALGDVTHTFANTGNFTIQISLTDEDGTFANVASVATQISAPAGTVSIVAQADGAANEGETFTRTIVFSDGADSNSDGWNYTVNWSDGVTQSGTTTTPQFELSRAFIDGSASPTATITVSDTSGTDSDTQSFSVSVANVAPTAAVTGADTVAEGSVYTLNVGVVADPGADTRTAYSINWGDGTTTALTAAEWATAAGSFTHTYADGAATPTITVSASDEDGSFVLGSKSLTVNNVAPALTLSGNAASNEGAAYALNIVGSDAAGGADPLSYSIDWGDGSAVQNLDAAALAALGGNMIHVFTDDQDGPVNATPRTISVTVADGDGGSETKSQVVTVNNVAPDLVISGATTATAGVAYTLSLVDVVDPGNDAVLTNGISVAWGDGSTSTYSGLGDVTHTYAADGLMAIRVSLTDEDGSYPDRAAINLTVNAPPATVSLEAGPDATLSEGDSFSRTINFADGTDNGALGWSYSIDYGDGTAAVTGTTLVKSLDLSHQYADGNANRTVGVTVTDAAGETASDSFNVSVANVAPTAAVTGADVVAEGSVYTLNVGVVADPGADTRTAYSINWGDGTTTALTVAEWATAAGSFSHTYADGAATPTITVSASDEDGSFILGSKSLTVNNVAPSVVLSGVASLNEGDTYTLNLVGSDPAGASDTLNYSIDWGDGSGVQALTAAQLAALSGNVTHTFTDDADGANNATDRNISVTVSDEDGGSSSTGKTVTVNNVAPDLTANGAAAGTSGVPYTLTLSNYIDPGQDTLAANGIGIDWGDGSGVQNVNALGDVTHTFANTGNFTIQISLTDEDGTFANVASVATQISAPAGTVSIVAQADGAANEGETFTRTIVFSDGADSNSDGWNYTVNWSDGVTQSGTTTTPQFELSRAFIDGSASPTATITVSDTSGTDSDTQSFSVSVANVAPTAAVTGADTVAEGSVYTLNVGVVADPGADTRTAYSINWGDGTTTALTAAEWATAAGSFTHTYADGAATPTITVSASDEDGSFVLGSKSLTVNNVAPALTLSGNAASNEGAAYVLNVAATDPAGANDILSYSIDWGDGSAVQTLTTAELAALFGTVNHLFADDEDGPTNATLRTISVTANDGDGGIATQTKGVTINNVDPTIALGGAGTAEVGQSYTLNLGAVTDPGTDTVASYSINWGDGNTQTVNAAGDVAHTYASTGNYTIAVGLTDEDGDHANAGSLGVTVDQVQVTTVRIGDAPVRQSGTGGQWAAAWTNDAIDIMHKADSTNGAESWSAATLHGVSPQTLAGGDIYSGDLGVSGQSLVTSTVRQEIDGKEGLRFNLDAEATEVTVGLSRFFVQDDGSLLAESGRLRLLDSSGTVVGETVFHAGDVSGAKLVTIGATEGFVAVELNAGVYDGDNFVFGGYANAAGDFASGPTTDSGGAKHGSDFLVDYVEFDFPVIGVPAPDVHIG